MMVCEFSPRFVQVQLIFFIVAILAVLCTSSFAFHPVTFPNYALVGHTYRSLQGLEWLNCIRSCHEDPKCFSYNFFHSTEDDTGECQMIDCGLDDPCSTERLVFSPGVVFQQIAATEFEEECHSQSEEHKEQSNFILDFPSPASESNYAKGNLKNPILTELTVCFWINSPKPEDRRTVFSYFGNNYKTELALEISDLNKIIFTVGGEERTITAEVNDSRWHHVCVVWSKSDGRFKFFQDGVVKEDKTEFRKNYSIISKGSLVLGQDQIDRNSFNLSKSFEGKLYNFNIWNRTLRKMTILRKFKNCRERGGNVIRWRRFKRGVKGNVKVVRPSACVLFNV
ncbi:C-reactive protein-like isoform X1 [Acropora muricata]|uniref:C-reactive protein-like isoform X1 n=1 Tax=Acropora muricata TaxID=159855 RepID=UPI0034E536EB